MKTKTHHSQSGFATVIIIVIVAVVAGVGTLGYLKIKDSQDTKAALATQKASDEKAAEAKSLAEKKAAEKETVTPEAAPATAAASPQATTTSPSTAAKPAPSPVAASNATAFTAANCTGNITVYVSNKGGAEASYYPPSSWKTIKTYGYGEALKARCIVGEGLGPDYVISGDAYIKSSNLSPTKP